MAAPGRRSRSLPRSWGRACDGQPPRRPRPAGAPASSDPAPRRPSCRCGRRDAGGGGGACRRPAPPVHAVEVAVKTFSTPSRPALRAASGRPPARQRRDGHLAPAPPFSQAGAGPHRARHVVLARPWGHIGATHGRSATDNNGLQRSAVVPGQQPYPGTSAGRPRGPWLSDTEGAGGSTPPAPTTPVLTRAFSDLNLRRSRIRCL
jgi:hypothetical protein